MFESVSACVICVIFLAVLYTVITTSVGIGYTVIFIVGDVRVGNCVHYCKCVLVCVSERYPCLFF